ncbi:tRNA dimethylallyltransferase 9 [Abeliophyllum distichum]|uniref:tRNA dimethylallyltransferase n=1 Tax=Abeliophyllum distichum TaxID=126358 RepID=A0ABD1UER3_9LAMI
MMGGFGIGGVRMSCLRLTSTVEAPLLRPSILPVSLNLRRRLIRPLATSCSATATKNKKEKVIVISGPTGAGKSRLALELAKRLNGEIISADSVQVYRGLDVGSAKPSLSERQEVPHHLIDILHPSEDYSVGQFYEDGRQVTNDVLNRGRVPIVAGGTGLYLRWFIYGKPDVPKASREITSEVHSELADLQRVGDWDAAVHLLVKAGDPSAQSLATNDWYRLRRRLEIIKSSGAPPSAFLVPYDSFRENFESSEADAVDINSASDGLQESKAKDLDYDFICVFLSTQRLDLYRSIDFRCEDMLLGDDGILSEAKWLLDLGLLPNSNSATRAIGYRQAMEYLLKCREQGGQISAQDFYTFLSEFQKSSRNFAKRQMTWFRNEPIYHWIDASKPLEKVLNFICDAYQDQNGNLRVPESLCMKKDMTNQREVMRLKAYHTKNRHFVGREDCTDILNWVRNQEQATGTTRLQWNGNLDEFSYAR